VVATADLLEVTLQNKLTSLKTLSLVY